MWSARACQSANRHFEQTWVCGWYYNPAYPGVYAANLWKWYYTPHAQQAWIGANITGNLLPYDVNYDGKTNMVDIGTRALLYYVLDSVATISNCTGCWSGLVVQGQSQVLVQNSHINWIKLYEHVGSLTFDQVDFAPELGCLQLYYSTTSLTGDFDFKLIGDHDASYYAAALSSTKITRNYNIATEAHSGDPLDNVELSLFDQDDTVVWNGHGDSLGHANFTLTFKDDNYTDTLRLQAEKGNLSAIVNISFLSDTPVTLALGSHDITMTGITPAKTVVSQGLNLLVNVTVVNKGDFGETCSVTLYANNTAVQTLGLHDPVGASAPLMFS